MKLLLLLQACNHLSLSSPLALHLHQRRHLYQSSLSSCTSTGLHFLRISLPSLSFSSSQSSRFPSQCLTTSCFSLLSAPPPPSPSTHNSLPVNLTEFLAFATSLYPLYVVVGGFLAVLNPSAFTWFVKAGPASYSFTLGCIMLAMGLSLSLHDLLHVVSKRPFPLLFGCASQYIIMPLVGAAISRVLNLPTSLSVGLILVACCPGGTASNVVTYIARGDVPLSVVMTICTTLGAVFATPLWTQYLAGAYVPVDAAGLALSTMQVVLAPVVVGAWLQSTFPTAVARIVPFSPLVAVLMSSLLACSVFSANVGRLGSFVELPSLSQMSAILTSSLGVVAQAVLLLHAAGFLLGYVVAALAGFSEAQRRAISIEVGMQNSSLGVVLATTHFTSPLVAVPAAISAVLMNVMGSSLAVAWRHYRDDN